MSFTDQKQRIATEQHVLFHWGGKAECGKRFRCYVCGHKFTVGDKWRWIFAGHKRLPNFLVCERCDGDDIMDRWEKQNAEGDSRFWWAFYEL